MTGRGASQSNEEGDASRLGEIADAVARGEDVGGGSGGGAGAEGGDAPRAGADAATRGDEDPARDAARMAVRAARALASAGLADPASLEADLARLREDSRASMTPEFPPDYEAIEEIGRGGGGVVYRARQRSLHREVALKMLHAGDSLFAASLARFEREARALARLSHPGIVTIHDVGSTAGRLWYAMSLVEGRSLAWRLRRGPLPANEAARIVRDVADAVAYVHEHGFIHRDLKPANVLLSEGGRVVVTDFGLALEVEGSKRADGDSVTLTGQVIGTPAYMAPEQARGDAESVGPATDVYALGAILYEALSGRRPFEGLSPPEQVYAAIHQDPRSLARSRGDGPRVPEDLVRVVEKAMKKRPGERYPSARALVEDLDRLLRGEPVHAARPNRWRRVGPWIGRHPSTVVGAVAAGGALALAAFVLAPSVRTDAKSEAFVEAADEAAARGDVESALRLYGRAAETASGTLAADVRQRAAEAEVPLARKWIDAGRAQEVLARVDAALANGHAPRDNPIATWPLRWAKALALAALSRRDEAKHELGDSFDAWVRERHDRAAELVGMMRAEWDWDGLARECQAAALAWLPVATDAGRRVAWFELKECPRLRFLRESAGVFARACARDPRTLVAAIEANVADPGGGPSLYETIGLWARSLVDEATPAMDEALAAVARNASRSSAARRDAAVVLAGVNDLPSALGLAALDLELVALDPEPTVAAWERLRSAGALDAYRVRVDTALDAWGDARLGAEAKTRARGWIVSHTSCVASTREEAAAWWSAHRADDPLPALAQAAGLSSGEPIDARAAIERWSQAQDRDRTRLHEVLRLLAPADAKTPRLPLEYGPRPDTLVRWRVVFGALGGPYRLRIAKAAWSVERGWHLEGGERRLDLDVGKVTTLHEEGPIPALPATYVTWRMLGSETIAAPSRLVVDLAATLAWKAEGLVVSVPRHTEMRVSAGSRAGGGGQGNPSQADVVFSPDVPIRGGSTPDERRNELYLAVVEARDADATPLSLDAWRARIAADFARIADEFEKSRASQRGSINRAPYDRQETIANLLAIATRLPVPGSADALRRVMEAVEDEEWFHREWAPWCLRARLLAGETALLASPDPLSVPTPRAVAADALPRPPRWPSSVDALDLRREAQGWIRTLTSDASPALKAFAAKRLEVVTFDRETAGDLLDVVRAGNLVPSPALARRLDDGPTDDRSFLGQAKALGGWTVLALVLDAAMLVALAFAIARRRRAGGGLVAWACVVGLGVVFASLDVVAAGIDLLPAGPGLVLAALGAGILSRRLRGRARWTAAVGFSVAAIAVVVPWPFAQGFVGLLGSIGLAAGVAWLPRLAYRLRGSPMTEAEANRPLSWAERHAWWGLLAVPVFFALVFLRSTWALIVVAVPLSFSLLRWLRDLSIEGRPWPRLFVLFYVLPVGIALAALVASWITAGAYSLTIRGDWTPLIPIAIGLATLWALLSLIGAARVRATWERAKPRLLGEATGSVD